MTNMRINALDDFTIELQYETQYTMRRRVLGPEIEGKIAQSSFGHSGLASAAGPTPATDTGSNFIQLQLHHRRLAVKIVRAQYPTGLWATSEGATYSAVEVLRDKRRVEIRALGPDDRADLLAAVGRTSEQSLYRRGREGQFHGAGNRILLEHRLRQSRRIGRSA
jgi:hypothetical protein